MTRKIALTLSAALGAAACADDGHDHEHDPATQSAAFEKAFEEKEHPKADSLQCSGVVVPDQSGFAKRVALTFDDGPNPATTPKVMEVLRRHGVPATFFINGSRVVDDETRAIAKEIVADPAFILANHTWSHPQMTQQTREVAAAQVDRTTAVIEAAGGSAEWFRFPFGASTCGTAEMVRSRGYTITGWHIDSADWCYARTGYCSPSTFRYVPDSMRGDMLGWVMKQVRDKDGGILLFHDIHPHTADQLEGIIETLKAEGYTFTNVDDQAAFPRLNGVTPPFIGDLCEEDADCAFNARSTPFCHGAGFCTVGCEGFCPDQPGKVPTFCVSDPVTEGATGICVSKATLDNGHCADLPGTIDASAERHLGRSSAAASTAEVCMPAESSEG